MSDVPPVPPVSSLVAAAVRIQQSRGESDREVADRMGVVVRETWNKVRRGERSVGPKVLSGIMRAFPDLRDDVLRYLQGED